MNDDVTDEEELDADLMAYNNSNVVREYRPEGIMRRFIAKVQSIDRGEVTERPKSAGIKQTRIFVSYSWHCRKEAVHEMAKFRMQQSDFHIWIDMENMTGHTYDSMAKGIDEADVVIVFFSRDYAESTNCRREIEYAANKNKELLPIRVEKGYRPDGWLLFIFQAQMRFDFCDGDNFYETASKICDHIRSLTPSSRNRQIKQTNEAKTNVNFRCAGAPFFSKSKYFNREDDEARIINQIRNVANCREDGCLVVSGDGGVGKTTLMARLFVDDKNHDFFVRECNFHRLIWINCFDWRDSFDEKAFTDKIISLAKELEDSERSANFGSIQSIGSFFRKKNLRVAYVLDDMFNYRLIQSFFEKHGDPPICFIVTRDAQTIIETNFGMVQKVERVEELTDDGIKDMLKTTFKLTKYLSDDQLFKLASLCCGLPLIASLIAARISNCEDRQEARSEFKVLTSPQYRIRDLKTQNRSFKTVSNLFTFSLDQMDPSLRSLYYAFLLFNPAEPVSIFDLGILWGFELDEDNRCGLRGVCRAFEKRSLVRRVKKQIVETEANEEDSNNTADGLCDDAHEDRFLVHQMLYEAAIEKAKKDCRLSGSDDECLAKIRVKLASSEMASADDEAPSGVSVLLGALKNNRRSLIDRIISNLSGEQLAVLFTKCSSQTDDIPFILYMYLFKSNSRGLRFLFQPELDLLANTNPGYKLISKVFTKLSEAGGSKLVLEVASKTKPDQRNSLLTSILDDALKEDQILDRLPLLTVMMRFFDVYTEMKWESSLLDPSTNTNSIILATFRGDFDEVARSYDDSLNKVVVAKAIQTAARRGFTKIVDFLLGKYPDGIMKYDGDKKTPIVMAAMNGHLETVQFLFKASPESARIIDINGRTPVHWCAKNGHLNGIKFFLEADRELVKTVDKKGTTVLMVSAGDGRLDIVKYLCENCPELIQLADHEMGTAIVPAALGGHISVVDYLYDKFSQEQHVRAVAMASVMGQVDVIRYLIERDPELATMNDKEKQISALMLAASTGHLNVVELLWGKSDTIYNPDSDNVTALMMAVTAGHLDIVKFIHSKDPEMVKITTSDGQTALTLARTLERKEILQYLQDNM